MGREILPNFLDGFPNSFVLGLFFGLSETNQNQTLQDANLGGEKYSNYRDSIPKCQKSSRVLYVSVCMPRIAVPWQRHQTSIAYMATKKCQFEPKNVT